ncbi:hypothetical protein [Haloferax denitrificans]|uniref:hypothetical protein n=1 Tax=Haloferax denitrificans TaxID=35745 RepID=UPI003C6F38D5
MSPHCRACLVACVLLAAGCVGTPAPTGTTTTATTAAETTQTTTATAATTTTATDSPTYGTEFVSVSKLENQSRADEWPDNKTARFENLSEPRKEVFRDALDGRVTFGPDEENPFAFNDSDRPELVRYEGEWYFVRVAVV